MVHSKDHPSIEEDPTITILDHTIIPLIRTSLIINAEQNSRKRLPKSPISNSPFRTQEVVRTTPPTIQKLPVLPNKAPPTEARQFTEAVSEVKINDCQPSPVGGRLLIFKAAWRGSHFESTISKGLSWSWEKLPPPAEILAQRSSPVSDLILQSLKKKRVIEKARVVLFQSRIFTVPKKDSPEERLILDLSFLNTFIKRPRFKMLTLKEIKLILPKGYWTTSVDLKDGYWHIAVSHSKRPFLGFRWGDQNWQFRAMPFGLNVAPRIFTKVIAHVVKIMAEAGIWCLPYLDDLLIIAESREECLYKTQKALDILTSLGWIINEKKSRLSPAQKFIWLGVLFDLSDHSAETPAETMASFQSLLTKIASAQTTSVREIMRLQGIANWISLQDPLVKLILPRTRKIIRSLRGLGLDTPISLNTEMRSSICRWIRGLPVPQALGSPSPNIVIQTDACLEGWGFLINRSAFAGKFDKTVPFSINVLETLTVWFSLLMVKKKGAVIQIMTDNTSAIAAVRRSTSLSYQLSAISELIWRRATDLRWTLSISHIQGCFNIIADQLSRQVELPSEWSLSQKDFKKILNWCPHLQVDLFATKLNYQLPTYVSPCPDEEAAAVDALSTPWNRWNHLYIFPPTNLISKVIAKMSDYPAETLVLVTPDFPSRPWFMSLMLRKIPSFHMEVTLQQIVVNRMAFQTQTTRLRVWKLSRHHLGKDFPNAKQ